MHHIQILSESHVVGNQRLSRKLTEGNSTVAYISCFSVMWGRKSFIGPVNAWIDTIERNRNDKDTYNVYV